MAILKDGLQLEKQSFSFRIYGNEPEKLSIAISSETDNVLLKMSRQETFILATKLLNAAMLLQEKK
jgi:transcriptional regulator of NAD metabolism